MSRAVIPPKAAKIQLLPVGKIAVIPPKAADAALHIDMIAVIPPKAVYLPVGKYPEWLTFAEQTRVNSG